MASKRFGPMKDFARAKKPRLDVSVTRGSSRPSPPRNNFDGIFWDDDDDDVILMATQLAEAEIEAEERKKKADPEVDVAHTEVTFSEFAPMGQGSTSTQQMFPPPPPPPSKKSTSMDMDAIFGDDDDFDFLAVTLIDTEPQKPPECKPSTSRSISTAISVQQKTSTTTMNATQSRQQEHQIKFLMDRIEALKQEKSQLEKNLGDSNERNEIKSGEVTLLRDELKHVRQQLQASKMEKLALADETNRDCNKKVAEAAKQIAAKDIELKMKNAEYSKLKTQQRAHEKSMNSSMSIVHAAPDHFEKRASLRLHRLNIHRSVPRLRIDNAIRFEYTEDEDQGKKRRSPFELELKPLLLHYAQLQVQPQSLDNLIPRVLTSVGKVFTEFASYVQRLDFPHNCMLYPYNPYNIEEELPRFSVSQQAALYENEKAVPLRRYIATLALICRQEERISSAILEWQQNDLGILDIAIEAVIKVGFSYEVSRHFGLLEALASLLNSLLQGKDLLQQNEDLLFNLLKQLVFTRPNPWVFAEVSSCLLRCLRHPQLMVKMCVNSHKDCFVSDRVRSVYRFGPDSCLLQVYSGLLELCFFSETPLRNDQFQLLLQIGGNHVRFAFECFKNPPDFILEMLPYFADDGEEDSGDGTLMKVGGNFSCSTTAAVQGSISNGSESAAASNSNLNSNSNSSSSQRGKDCECYVKLCLSAVTIVFQVMHQWMLHERKTGTEEVGEISRIAVHLLTLVFHEYYLTCLFRDSEETTKHYLSLICNWWSEHADLLGFQPIQLRLLKQLVKAHFMLKPLHQEANRNNPGNDLSEWNRIVKNADAQKSVSSGQKFDPRKLLDIDFFSALKRKESTFE
ncbi:ATR-interacting protein mus304 isoform X1 [Drosophila gunungcola]|uniref:ATR-interacting protein mus304 isoform X1 n=1 Tax=Drosophila gunungcola TaxID=103775 RepID=UPI0022E1CF03|nr:ATR-interacting protein mus304 isoform X1 [Drosophila gunungcola]